MTIPLQFAFLCNDQIFMWSDCLLDLGTKKTKIAVWSRAVAQLAEHWVWHDADRGSTPQVQQGIFPSSDLSVQTLKMFVQPPHAVAHTNIRVHVENPKHYHCLDT